MKRLATITLALVLAGCGVLRPPTLPSPSTYGTTVRVTDDAEALLAGVAIEIRGGGEIFMIAERTDHVGGLPVDGLRQSGLEACGVKDGHEPACAPIVRGQTETRIVLKRVPPPAPKELERVSGAALLDVAGNFCNLFDSFGRIVYTPALPGAPDDVYAEWMQLQREAGSTHVFVGPFDGGPAYPGVAWSNPDLLTDPSQLRAFILKLLSTPSANGKGFVPVLFLDGGGRNPRPRIEQHWPRIADALADLQEFLIVVPAWEPVVGDWTSAELSFALQRLAAYFPRSQIGWHGSPTRWVGSSNPIEPDDPWQGGESEFYKKHGGQFVTVAFYQTPHGIEHWRDCNEDTDDNCWLNRWQDGVRRLGAAFNGWRRMKVVLYETVAFEAFRKQTTSRQARETATLGQRICRKWNVDCGYGNGLPVDWGVAR